MSVLSSFIRPFHSLRKLTGRGLISIDQGQIEFVRGNDIRSFYSKGISRIVIYQMLEISVAMMDVNVTRFSNIS